MNIEWNGHGLPPVGCECEYTMNGGATWWRCVVKYIVGSSGVVMACDCAGGEQYVHFEHYNSKTEKFKFRPIRTEAERNRDERILCLNNFIGGFMKSTGGDHTHLGEALYEWLSVLDRLK